jgi:uncharacterized protein (DUF3084 family)
LQQEHDFWRRADEQKAKAEREEWKNKLDKAESQCVKLQEEANRLHTQIHRMEVEISELHIHRRDLEKCEVMKESLETDYKALLAKQEGLSMKAASEEKARRIAESNCQV